MKRLLQAFLTAAAFCAAVPYVYAKPLQVVTTMSTFADLAKAIGGEYVQVSYVASPRFNPHFIEPRPSDVVRVKRAQLFIHAGLDLEAWRGPLLDAAGNLSVMPGGERELDLSKGIALLEVPTSPVSRSQGDIHLFGNPHYWVDPENAIIMCKAIASKLSALDPEHAAEYDSRMRVYTRALYQRIQEWKRSLAPFSGQQLVGYHNEWPYLMRFAGLKMEQFLEPKPGIPPTPKQVEYIEQYVQSKKIKTLVISTYFPRDSADVVAKRTGIRVIDLVQNVGEIPQAKDYVSMTDYNVGQLVGALQGASNG